MKKTEIYINSKYPQQDINIIKALGYIEDTLTSVKLGNIKYQCTDKTQNSIDLLNNNNIIGHLYTDTMLLICEDMEIDIVIEDKDWSKLFKNGEFSNNINKDVKKALVRAFKELKQY